MQLLLNYMTIGAIFISLIYLYDWWRVPYAQSGRQQPGWKWLLCIAIWPLAVIYVIRRVVQIVSLGLRS